MDKITKPIHQLGRIHGSSERLVLSTAISGQQSSKPWNKFKQRELHVTRTQTAAALLRQFTDHRITVTGS